MTCGIVALSDEGDSFLVSAEEEGPVTLRSYLHIDEVVDEFSGTWSELKKPLGLCAEVLVIRYADPATSGAPRPYSHNTGDSPNNSSSFVTDQFLNHKRYAWGIIGISVVLALLGVATPLGFQTFADKILPYSAMNSLIVAVVLLLLAAVVAVISLLVVLPILFVYSVQLSLVVLAIGFDMAFTVGVALRPLRNRVQQAYGYDASFQSVLFDTLEPPISSRFWN